MRSSVLLALAVLALAASLAAAASSASASPRMLKGIYDEAQAIGNPDRSFPVLARLRVRLVRVQLAWGGPRGVAKRRPKVAADPSDPAYDWTVYDNLVTTAARYRIKVVFAIWATPGWANRGRGIRVAPLKAADLRAFAAAAARRYSGRFVPESAENGENGENAERPKRLPRVDHWLAWNEPNNPIFLRPQFRRVRGKWVIWSAREYAKICNAVVGGVRSVRVRTQKIACGVTAPRGNNRARSKRASVSPLYFLRAMKRAGARGFHAFAHHPYYGRPSESPFTRPPARTAITLGNIDVLIGELTRLYGRKPLWITEYGYQTRPPDRIFGVSRKLQARYLAQAYRFARRHPRIDMFMWFLLRDERRLSGWQSGLLTWNGRKKPAFDVFRRLR